ncbi:hypothetical protein GRAN_0756 [Granulicella sibirica]|uniref:Uncharacterized protein n=1 Tax=Granulicella sibirica TaxID=2479048 RepID=A0A4Q0T714_9BACT|nr:hypothetical protein GRAN_0756 [Granulicella sibirica]
MVGCWSHVVPFSRGAGDSPARCGESRSGEESCCIENCVFGPCGYRRKVLDCDAVVPRLGSVFANPWVLRAYGPWKASSCGS